MLVNSTTRRRRRAHSLSLCLAASAVALGSTVAFGTAQAHAEPVTFALPAADAPVPVSGNEYSYIATHAITRQIRGMNLPDGIAALPVPEQYKPANLGLAQQFDIALDAALASPGGCIQVVVDPTPRGSALFDYGFFPVAGAYCS